MMGGVLERFGAVYHWGGGVGCDLDDAGCHSLKWRGGIFRALHRARDLVSAAARRVAAVQHEGRTTAAEGRSYMWPRFSSSSSEW